MLTTMEWIRDELRDHPELALFLALAAGYYLGRFRIGSFKLGPVVGCLLAGVAVGQIGIAVPGALGTKFFLVFLFSVGYKTGPQFFRGLGRNSIPQVVLTLLFDATGLLMTYAVALVFGFNAGTAAGLLAGALHSTEALGTEVMRLEGLKWQRRFVGHLRLTQRRPTQCRTWSEYLRQSSYLSGLVHGL